MKLGADKTFVYIPVLGFIEAADTMEWTMKKIGEIEARKEIEDKKTLRRLKRENPGKSIVQEGNIWVISENPIDEDEDYYP